MRLIIICCVVLALTGCGSAGAVMPSIAPTPQAPIPEEDRVTITSLPPPEDEQPTPLPASTDAPTVPPVATIQPSPSSPPAATPSAPAPAFRRATHAPVQAEATVSVAPPAPSALALDPAFADVVETARADLAQRQGVARAAITVVEVRNVIWPNAGLGCPQPGVAYKQVTVDGILIRLSIGKRVFAYHGGGTKGPFLCDQPQASVPPVSSGGDQ